MFASRVLCMLALVVNVTAARADQGQALDNNVYYQVKGLIRVQRFDPVCGRFLDQIKVPRPPLKFYVVGKVTFPAATAATVAGTLPEHCDAPGSPGPSSTPALPPDGVDWLQRALAETMTDAIAPASNQPVDGAYYLIKFYSINSGSDPYIGDRSYINAADTKADAVYAVRIDELVAAVADGFVETRHRTGLASREWAYGGSLSVPFKLRRAIDDNTPRRLSTEVSLGGYIGGRFRLSATRPVYLSGVITAGLAALPVNDDSNGETSAGKGDATVLGITAGGGAVLQLDDFQVGVIVGRDWASGLYAKDWVYDNRTWVSFSVGFTFLDKKSDTRPAKAKP